MKRAALMLAAMLGVMFGVGYASARPSVPTRITHDGTVPLASGRFILTGHVSPGKTTASSAGS